MSSREKILNSIRKHLPAKQDYPAPPAFEGSKDLQGDFRDHLEFSGGKCMEADVKALDQLIKDIFPEATRIFKSFGDEPAPAFPLDQLEVAVIRADFGVAENGAVWVPEQNLSSRELPVITEHLIVLVDKDQLVSNMHEAYDRISNLPGYGLFISGPSKTADIEQSLVIGAHGPKSHTVLLI